MRRLAIALTVALGSWQTSPAWSADGYIIGVKPDTKLLTFHEAPAAPAKYELNADEFIGPLPISDKEGEWLEVVVNDEYLWVPASEVVVNRPRVKSLRSTAPAASSGARLHLRAN